eukprot:gene7391-9082_t
MNWKNKEERTIVLMGKTTSDITALTNMFKNTEYIHPNHTIFHETRNVSLETIEVEMDILGQNQQNIETIKYNLNIVDTPEIFELGVLLNEERSNQVKWNIQNILPPTKSRIHAFCIVINSEVGLNRNDLETIGNVKKYFSNYSSNFMMIITGSPSKSNDGMDQFLNDFKNQEVTSELFKFFKLGFYFTGFLHTDRLVEYKEFPQMKNRDTENSKNAYKACTFSIYLYSKSNYDKVQYSFQGMIPTMTLISESDPTTNQTIYYAYCSVGCFDPSLSNRVTFTMEKDSFAKQQNITIACSVREDDLVVEKKKELFTLGNGECLLSNQFYVYSQYRVDVALSIDSGMSCWYSEIGTSYHPKPNGVYTICCKFTNTIDQGGSATISFKHLNGYNISFPIKIDTSKYQSILDSPINQFTASFQPNITIIQQSRPGLFEHGLDTTFEVTTPSPSPDLYPFFTTINTYPTVSSNYHPVSTKGNTIKYWSLSKIVENGQGSTLSFYKVSQQLSFGRLISDSYNYNIGKSLPSLDDINPENITSTLTKYIVFQFRAEDFNWVVVPNINNRRLDPPIYFNNFPYGLHKGDMKNMFFSFANVYPSTYKANQDIKIVRTIEEINLNTSFENFGDTQQPFLVDFSYKDLSNNNILFTIVARDESVGDTGVWKILVFGKYIFTKLDLVDGTKFKGTYQKIIHLSESFEQLITQSSEYIKIIDYANNVNSYSYARNPYFPINLLPPIIFKNNYKIEDINLFKFKYNEIDMNNKKVEMENTLYIGINENVLDLLWKPQLVLEKYPFLERSHPLREMNRLVFEGKWNPVLKLFEIPFKIPIGTLQGALKYSIGLDSTSELLSKDLESIFGQGSRVDIKNENGDHLGPIVTNIMAKNKTINYNSGVLQSIEWVFVVEDFTGLKSIEVEVTSNMDFKPYKFTKSYDQIPASEPGPYSISVSFPITLPISQTFSITGIKTIDFCGNTLTSVGGISNLVVADPKNLNTETITVYGLPISTMYIQDTNVTDLRITSDTNGVLNITATVKDSIGLSPIHQPMLFLSNIDGVLLNYTMNELTSNSDKTQVIYNCLISDLPPRYGPDMFFSIYGIVNRYLKIKGFNFKDLSVYGVSFGIPVKNSPVINSASSISSLDTYLSISGSNFGVDKNKLILDQLINGTSNPISIDTISNSWLLLKITPSETPSNITLKTDFGSTFVVVTPIVVKDPTPAPSKCINNCNAPNGGECQENIGCICKDGFSGLDCTKIILEVPKPNFNTSAPNTNTTVTDSGSIVLSSILNVVSIRETNPLGKVENEYIFDKWEFKNQTNDSSTFFQYKAIGSPLDVVVTVQYFDQDTIVKFANLEIPISKSTAKYSIELGPYVFKSTINFLQVIMSSKLVSYETQCQDQLDTQMDVTDLGVDKVVEVKIKDKILHGKFINIGIIDGKVGSVSNTVISNTTLNDVEDGSTVSSTLVAINVKFYAIKAILDPNFSILTDPNHQDKTCGKRKSSGLLTKEIIGIVFGVVGFITILIIVIAILVRKYKWRFMVLKKAIKMDKIAK